MHRGMYACACQSKIQFWFSFQKILFLSLGHMQTYFVNPGMPFLDLYEKGQRYGFVHYVLSLAARSLGVFSCSRFFNVQK